MNDGEGIVGVSGVNLGLAGPYEPRTTRVYPFSLLLLPKVLPKRNFQLIQLEQRTDIMSP
jgi:hypothetical protein